MNANHLLKFLNKDAGPIVRLQSFMVLNSPQLYYSVAELSEEITKGFRHDDLLQFGGGGWSSDKILSQEKAITEAIERWAFKYITDTSPVLAGLDIDPSSNGFAALPKAFDIKNAFQHSLFESIERYLLQQFDSKNFFKLNKISMPHRLEKLLDITNCHFDSYVSNLHINCNLKEFGYKGDLNFVLSLLWISNLGVIPGSSCHPNLEQAQEKSIIECYNNHNAFKKILNVGLKPNCSITDKRLKYYGENTNCAFLIKENIANSLNALPPIVPDILLAEKYEGPWSPNVSITRVLLKNAGSFLDGDEKRFLI